MKIDIEILKKIRLEDLETYRIVCRLKSFSVAAKQLNKTQSSISQQINRMESLLNTNLIVRTSRSFKITNDGIKFLKFAIDTIEKFEVILSEIKTSHKEFPSDFSGVINIFSSSIPGEYILPNIIKEFNQKFPNVELNIEIKNSSSALEKLSKGTIDFAAIGFELSLSGIKNYQKFETKLIGEDKLYFLCSRNHPLAKRKSPISLDEIYKFPFILREKGSATRVAFENSKYYNNTIQIALTITSNQSILSSIRESDYITVMSRYSIHSVLGEHNLETYNENFQIISPDEYIPIQRNFYLVRKTKENNTPLNQAFWEF